MSKTGNLGRDEKKNGGNKSGCTKKKALRQKYRTVAGVKGNGPVVFGEREMEHEVRRVNLRERSSQLTLEKKKRMDALGKPRCQMKARKGKKVPTHTMGGKERDMRSATWEGKNRRLTHDLGTGRRVCSTNHHHQPFQVKRLTY